MSTPNRFDTQIVRDGARETLKYIFDRWNRHGLTFLNSIVLIILAELTFLGTILLNSDATNPTLLTKSLAISLLVSLILFLCANISLGTEIGKMSNNYKSIHRKADGALGRGESSLQLSKEEANMVFKGSDFSNTTKLLMGFSILLVIASTIGIIFMVIGI